MPEELLKSVTVIIRSANERTEQLCKKLVLEQGINEENVFIVREVPFSAAMEKSFNIGLDNDLKWTCCVDADVLLRTGSIKRMVELAENQNSNTCGIQSLILDKFFGGPRDGGIHLYRTSLLNKVISKIPEEGTDIRPETYTLEQMEKEGHPWKKIPVVIGLHDHEQYFFDIYRKCYTQGVKHAYRLELFVKLWRQKVKEDRDFEVALKALADSIYNTDDVFINRELDIFKEGFDALDIAEKEEIDITEYDLKTVDKIIEQWKYPDIYYKYFPYAAGLISNFEFHKRKLISGFRRYSFTDFIKKSFQYLLPIR